LEQGKQGVWGDDTLIVDLPGRRLSATIRLGKKKRGTNKGRRKNQAKGSPTTYRKKGKYRTRGVFKNGGYQGFKGGRKWTNLGEGREKVRLKEGVEERETKEIHGANWGAQKTWGGRHQRRLAGGGGRRSVLVMNEPLGQNQVGKKKGGHRCIWEETYCQRFGKKREGKRGITVGSSRACVEWGRKLGGTDQG